MINKRERLKGLSFFYEDDYKNFDLKVVKRGLGSSASLFIIIL